MIKVSGKLLKAMEISQWLKDKGYKHDVDYNWRLESSINIIVFACKDERMETLIALKWSEHI